MDAGPHHQHMELGADQYSHMLARDTVQLTCKLVDPEVNGGFRYRAWAHHRERVLERLGGWQLVANGQDFATFNIPQSIVSAAAMERQAKIPKEERRYWGDKSDFCRCLETVLNEMEPRAEAPTPSSYLLFCQDKRQEHKEQGHATQLDVKVLGAMWKGLSEEERKPWVEKSEQLKASGASALDSSRKRSKKASSLGVCGQVLVHPLPPSVQQVCSENGLDSIDYVVGIIEGKQPVELMAYERRLRGCFIHLASQKIFVALQCTAKGCVPVCLCVMCSAAAVAALLAALPPPPQPSPPEPSPERLYDLAKSHAGLRGF